MVRVQSASFFPRVIPYVLSLFFLIYGGLKVGVLGRSSLIIFLPASKLLHLDWSHDGATLMLAMFIKLDLDLLLGLWDYC